MDDWQERALEKFLARITYGFTNPMPTTDIGPYMVTARDINHGRILYDQARSTSEKAFKEDLTDKSRPDIGDVLVTKDGTLGRVAIVDRSNVCINQSVALLKPSPSIRSRFLKYVLEEPNNHQRMLGDADGTTIKHIYITRLAEMKVCVPSLATQDAVVSVLGALDDKIDLNRRMNETLEVMARAIFKDWFVDFGPTRAKMEGRPPYLAPEIWALFPDRLDDEGNPEGWISSTLGEHTLNFDFKRVPVSGGERAKRQGPYPYHGATGVMDYVDDYLFDGVYLLVGEDGSVVKESGLAFTQFVWGKFWVNNHAHVLQGKGFVSTEQLLMYFQHQPVAPYITGAVQLKLSQGRMNSMPFRYAGEGVCKMFAEVVAQLFARLRANADENSVLTQTRDLLLPKLMSGEVRVKEAEKVVEAAL